MAPIATTQRLRLREFSPADLDALAPMVADPEQMRFYPRPRSRQEAAAWIERTVACYERHGFGFWLVESAADGAFLGYCGIRPLDIDGVAEVEVGWHVHRRAWGQGIATESANAALEIARTRFGLSRLVATIVPDNAPSRRVAEKLDMRVEGTAVLEGDEYLVYACGAGSPTSSSNGSAARGSR